MKHIYFILLVALGGIFVVQCSSNTEHANNSATSDTSAKKQRVDTVVVFVGINNKGVGRFRDVKLQLPLNQAMVSKG